MNPTLGQKLVPTVSRMDSLLRLWPRELMVVVTPP